jgi:hypothetical protein
MNFYLFYFDYALSINEFEIYYLSENELSNKIKLPKYAKSNCNCKQIKTLAELIFEITEKDHYFFTDVAPFFYDCSISYGKLSERFGIEVLQNAFPNEQFDLKLEEELHRMLKEYFHDISKAWQSADSIQSNDISDKSYDSFLDQMNDGLNKDDEGFWQISNDIG